MIGYNLDYSEFDKLLPYAIRHIKNPEDGETFGFGRKDLEIYHKETGKIVHKYEYNYSSYGDCSFYQFQYNKRWYAVFSPLYYETNIIDLQTGEIVAKNEEDHNTSWCPTNYYVPAFYCNKIPHTYKDGSQTYRVYCDFELRPSSEKNENLNINDIIWSNHLFACGVFWAADNEWLVFKYDIKTILETGIIPDPHEDTYCFEFDYGADPEIRQFLYAQRPYVRTVEELEKIPNHGRFQFYTQKFTYDCFKDKGNDG